MTLQGPILMVVTDPSIPNLMEGLSNAIAGGARLIQYRDKTATTEQRIQWVRAFRERFSEAHVVVNDDLAAVEQANADGLHMSAAYPCDTLSERPVGPGRLVGRSIHSDEFDSEIARRCGLDYVVYGTVYPSETHPGDQTTGPDGLKTVCEAVGRRVGRLPVLAIGGINATNAGECVRAGAAGVAVIRSVLMAADPARAVAEILSAMREVAK
jgi:thiamine-phosphate pyrophosphorylase